MALQRCNEISTEPDAGCTTEGFVRGFRQRHFSGLTAEMATKHLVIPLADWFCTLRCRCCPQVLLNSGMCRWVPAHRCSPRSWQEQQTDGSRPMARAADSALRRRNRCTCTMLVCKGGTRKLSRSMQDGHVLQTSQGRCEPTKLHQGGSNPRAALCPARPFGRLKLAQCALQLCVVLRSHKLETSSSRLPNNYANT